jgi:hypothetical protein
MTRGVVHGEGCPKCRCAKSVVFDSRPSPLGRMRRRQCCKCAWRWSTYEIQVGDAGHLHDVQEELAMCLQMLNTLWTRLENLRDRMPKSALAHLKLAADQAA